MKLNLFAIFAADFSAKKKIKNANKQIARGHRRLALVVVAGNEPTAITFIMTRPSRTCNHVPLSTTCIH